MGTTKVRKRAAALATAFIAAVGVAAVVIPSLAASAPLPSAVRLHLGNDGQYFTYDADPQLLPTSGCKLTNAAAAGPIIKLSAGNNKSPGLVDKGLGVKGSNATGTPCGQVDGTETLKLERGSSLGTRQFTGVRLDLEMTGDAIVKLTLSSSTTSAVFKLQTGRSITAAQSGEAGYVGTVPYSAAYNPEVDFASGDVDGAVYDACAAPNSSGPNSTINDNCQWTVRPGFPFDTITLATSGGSVALEGGGDFGGTNDDTMLYLANTAPTATNNAYTTDEDVSVQGNVLTDAPADSDADGNPLTAAAVTGDGKGPEHGSVTVATNGDFTYTPEANWFGTDFFTYAASDGTATSEATITITVTPVNDRPVAVVQDPDDPPSTEEDTSVTVTVATDVDNTTVFSDCTADDDDDPFTPFEGTLPVDNENGTVDFLPPLDFNGSITLTCTASDGLLTTTSSATIVVGVDPVNDPPVAVHDIDDVDENSSVVIDVLANDTDPDLRDTPPDRLSVTNLDLVSLKGGSVVDNLDGTVTYTPPSDFDGVDSFTYAVTDGDPDTIPDQATVEITVFPVICRLDTVYTPPGTDASGAFTRLNDTQECKRYALEADDAGGGAVLFVPQGGDPAGPPVFYRGVVSFGAEAAPADGKFPLLLRYDPDDDGPDPPRNVLWCINPQFAGGVVTSADLPAGESWCVASADTRGSGDGLVTTWEVYGKADPKFLR